MAPDRRRALIGWSITVAVILFLVGIGAVIRHHSNGRSVAVPTPAAPNPTTTVSASVPGGSTSSTTGATTLVPVTPSSTAPTAPPGPPTQCHTADLAITDAPGHVARGNLYGTMVIINNATSACTLMGYTGAQRVDANGVPMDNNHTTVQRNRNAPVQRITVAPQQQASFGYSTATGSSCPHAAKLLVTPPDDTTQVTVTSTLPDCQSDVTFGPIQSGTGASIG